MPLLNPDEEDFFHKLAHLTYYAVNSYQMHHHTSSGAIQRLAGAVTVFQILPTRKDAWIAGLKKSVHWFCLKVMDLLIISMYF